MRGDYVESLPALLADRREGTQLVVFQTASTMYLDQGALAKVRAAFHEAARQERLVFLTTGRAPEDDLALLDALGMPVADGPREGRFVVDGAGAHARPARAPERPRTVISVSAE